MKGIANDIEIREALISCVIYERMEMTKLLLNMHVIFSFDIVLIF